MNKVDFSKEYKRIIASFVKAAIKAGDSILSVYQGNDFSVEYKEDDSPLTKADKMSNEIIMDALLRLNKTLLSDIPIISEESKQIPYSKRRNYDYFYLVDPLDGTKEFIKKNGEFTVNIALVEKDTPLIGVMLAPYTGDIYFAYTPKGAYRINLESAKNLCDKNSDDNALCEGLIKEARSLPFSEYENENIVRVVASRSHLCEKTKALISDIKLKEKKVEVVSAGSALKLCLVALGYAKYYPRYTPTMEWDTAAGHAILLSLGVDIFLLDGKTPLRYNKSDLKNEGFIVTY